MHHYLSLPLPHYVEGCEAPWQPPKATHDALAPRIHSQGLPRDHAHYRALNGPRGALSRAAASPLVGCPPQPLECLLSPLCVGSLPPPSPPSASTSTAQASKRGQVCVYLQGVCVVRVRSQAACNMHAGLQRGPRHGALPRKGKDSRNTARGGGRGALKGATPPPTTMPKQAPSAPNIEGAPKEERY